MAVVNTKNFSYLMDPTYRKIFFKQYGEFRSVMPQLFNVETVSKGNWVAEAMLSPLGAAGIVPEGNPIQFEYPVQGNAVKKYFTKYGLGFQLTEEQQDDDLSGHMAKMPAELGVSVAYSRELAMADLFNNGNSTTYYTCMTGYAPFYTAHPTLKYPGTTQANLAASSGALSYSTYQAALDTIYGWKDEAGRPIAGYEPRYLVVPTNLRWMAELLTKNKEEPNSADRNISTTNSLYPGVTPLVVPYLTSTTAWFIVCAKNDIRFTWRRNVKFGSSDDFSTGNALFKATARWLVWCYDWRGIYRNSGA